MKPLKIDKSDKRVFPRMDAECAILYAIGKSGKWKVGKMLNYSATGLLMLCKEPLVKNIAITINIKPGKNKVIPELFAKGKVIRSSFKEDGHYEVSCKLTEVKPSK